MGHFQAARFGAFGGGSPHPDSGASDEKHWREGRRPGPPSDIGVVTDSESSDESSFTREGRSQRARPADGESSGESHRREGRRPAQRRSRLVALSSATPVLSASATPIHRSPVLSTSDVPAASGTASGKAKPRGNHPRGKPAAYVSEVEQYITRAKLRIRASMELQSEVVGELPAQSFVVVLERAIARDGTQRALVGRPTPSPTPGAPTPSASLVGTGAGTGTPTPSASPIGTDAPAPSALPTGTGAPAPSASPTGTGAGTGAPTPSALRPPSASPTPPRVSEETSAPRRLGRRQ